MNDDPILLTFIKGKKQVLWKFNGKEESWESYTYNNKCMNERKEALIYNIVYLLYKCLQKQKKNKPIFDARASL